MFIQFLKLLYLPMVKLKQFEIVSQLVNSNQLTHRNNIGVRQSQYVLQVLNLDKEISHII